jgi:hypothetical protein
MLRASRLYHNGKASSDESLDELEIVRQNLIYGIEKIKDLGAEKYRRQVLVGIAALKVIDELIEGKRKPHD